MSDRYPGIATEVVEALRDENAALTARAEKAEAHITELESEAEAQVGVFADAAMLAKLACSSSWPLDMAQSVESAAARVIALLHASPSDGAR
jgi:hypothetical protein